MHAGRDSAERPRSAALDREALTVAMALVPGMYARNRMFALFREPEVKRAKARAALIRGVVRHLAGSHGEPEGFTLGRHGEVCVLRYRVPAMRLERRVEISETERACLLFLGARAGVKHMHLSADDRAHVESVLRRLAAAEPMASRAMTDAALAHDSPPPLRLRPSELPPAE